MDPIRVLIVDDHPVVRQGLRSLLSQYPDIEVAGDCENGQDALDLTANRKPSVILLDIRLNDESGLNVARRLQRAHPEVRLIILTSYDDESYLLEAARVGVHGYLLKSSSPEVLANAIRVAHTGGQSLAPELASKAMGQLNALSRHIVRARAGLSEQEVQLLKLIADGATATEMINALNLSERTIARKIQSVLEKLGTTSRAQAVSEAYKRGLL